MILHILLNEKFTEPIISKISAHFEASAHQFIVIGKGFGAKLTKRANVLEVKGFLHAIIPLTRAMYQAEQIIIHSLFNRRLVQYLALQPWLLKKCNWIVWGGDLFWRLTHTKTLSNILYESVRRRVIRRLGTISTLVPGDYQLAKQWYATTARHRQAIYYHSVNQSELDERFAATRRSTAGKREWVVQLGNSADPNNQHMQVLLMLSKFKEDSLRIVAPLSYGDRAYGERVASYGKQLFGEKFTALFDFLPIEQYTAWLDSVDVAIFFHDRQQALGNIRVLIYLGKKVFLRQSITSWVHFKEELDVHIYATQAIETMTFAEFTEFDVDRQLHNRAVLAHQFDEAYITSLWSLIFERMTTKSD